MAALRVRAAIVRFMLQADRTRHEVTAVACRCGFARRISKNLSGGSGSGGGSSRAMAIMHGACGWKNLGLKLRIKKRPSGLHMLLEALHVSDRPQHAARTKGRTEAH